MTHHWIRTGLDRLRRTGAALTAAACALGLPGFFARQTPASAANLVLVYAESVEAQPGDTAQVSLYAEDNGGFSGMGLVLEYDGALELVTNEYGKPLCTYGDLIGSDTCMILEAEGSKCGVAIASSQLIQQDGTLVTLSFRVPQTAQPGDTFALNLTANAAYDNRDNAVSIQTYSGKIQIPQATTTEPTTTTETTTTTTTTTETTTAPGTPVEFSVGNVPGLPGETVYLPVYVGENPGLSAAVLTFRYGGMLQPADANSTPQVQYLKAGYWGEVSYDTQLLTVSMHAAWSQYENGEILRIPVAIPADAVPGIYPVTPESASFAAMDGSTRQCSLFAGTVQVVGAVTTSAQVTENTTTTGYTTTATEAVTTTETTITTTTTTTETTIETTTTTAAETTTVPIQTTTATRTTALQPGYLPGDVNMDGRVTVADAVLVLEACARMAAGEPCPLSDEQQKLGDLVPDGYIKVSDAVELLGIIARGIAG
ncbi:cohesin domain [Ruminococcus sp. CAG:379]|uniref:cohesin domain-containing protein n=1 Tax=Ruminococcus sp. CAG:379 TaxID=1262956 RepID=UPI00033666BF|nr:cohesin domain-containing protein [Ruminococcus sp. CAG:379]CDD52738.1 cohesin domain [Ruminococcus sp. CAG:379]